MKYCGLSAAVALIAVVTSASAMRGKDDFSEGFGAQSVEQFVQSEQSFKGSSQASAKRFQAATATAALIHDGMAKDAERLRGKFGEDGKRAIGMILPQGSDPEMAKLWGSFFSSSVTLIGAGLSDAPVVGYYNPLVDGWVIASLARDASGLQLTSMTVLSGETLRHFAKITLPHGTKYKSPVFDTYRSSAKAFETLYPPTSGKVIGVRSGDAMQEYDTVMRRTIQMAGIVEMELKQPKLAKALGAFEHTIARGNALEVRELFAGKTTTPPEWLAGISAPVRKSLKPAAMFRNEDGMQVAFVSPAASRMVVLLNVNNPGSAEPKFDDIIVSDYAYINGSN